MSEFFLDIQKLGCDSIVYETRHMSTDKHIYILYDWCIDVDRPCSMCFCYRSCEEGRGEAGNLAEKAEAPELVPWETCSIA